jgi:hypothetical protein
MEKVEIPEGKSSQADYEDLLDSGNIRMSEVTS